MSGTVLHDFKTPRSILFMCGMNAIRSPMAEALARAALPKGTYVASAGVRHGERDPFVDVVLEEVGLTIGRHQPRTLDELEDDYFDLIVTLAPEAHHLALELTRSMAVDVVYWPTPDPTVATGTRDQIVGAYRAVRDHLAGLIASRLTGQSLRKGA
ncbi:low molecular weight phosphatase family protein [Sinorhizobium alkalisoli]|uniref:Protein-tyrosine-phosphatase n=1 Tax=Sinorhizobium alkalisoli TaxID=1752398 RepID=A0A1E3VAG7_9HYPH|nr:low molecular weight phosphatase family protein [Sinorhizobium alkalisoli]MCA1489329.1 low molecular weight phosphatase family protein [Ensifer sp. NBAIM29]MCG5477593.1 low molecular weight phosphatase family protein [Sinorhizobium alkalisoli]ODR89826.1 protein-tyrosine-phosphatase [Sinorhizobium alkalisoli]